MELLTCSVIHRLPQSLRPPPTHKPPSRVPRRSDEEQTLRSCSSTHTAAVHASVSATTPVSDLPSRHTLTAHMRMLQMLVVTREREQKRTKMLLVKSHLQSTDLVCAEGEPNLQYILQTQWKSAKMKDIVHTNSVDDRDYPSMHQELKKDSLRWLLDNKYTKYFVSGNVCFLWSLTGSGTVWHHQYTYCHFLLVQTEKWIFMLYLYANKNYNKQNIHYILFITLCFTWTVILFFLVINLTLSSGCTQRPSACLIATATAHRQGSEVAGRRGRGRDAPCPPTSSAPSTALWTEQSEQLGTWNTPLGTWLALWLPGCSTRSCWPSPAASSLESLRKL